MTDHDHALMLFGMSMKDFQALCGMIDSAQFADEVFGFHAQQAVEKALKAWLSEKNLEYPQTHDLGLLLSLLKESGEKVGGLELLVEYNSFAVQYRYEAMDLSEEPALDRKAIVESVRALTWKVSKIIKPRASGP